MKPFIQISLPTGHVFEISTAVIANHRAATMLDLHKDEFSNIAEALTDTHELFEDGYCIRDWASNQMDLNELTSGARMIRFSPPEHDWNASDWSYHDYKSMIGEIDADSILRSPIEMVLNTMASSQQLCNVTILGGDDGQPYAALALIVGNEPVIGAFVSALRFTGDQVAANLPKSFSQ